MRVTLCVDALGPKLSGIGRYTWELCKGLARRDDIDLSFYGRHRLIEDPSQLMSGGPLSRRRWGLRRLGKWRDSRKLKASLVHGPNYFLPHFAECGVITVHDLSVFRYPETHPVERIRAFEAEFEYSLARASHIITDTETVRQELIENFGVDGGRLTAIHLGVDRHFHPFAAQADRATFSLFGLSPKGYALCVSTLEPRKKIAELLDAWRRLPADLKQQYPLVLAGGAGWRNDDLHTKIKQGQAEGWLRYLGFVEEALLPALYARAALFLYPSIYEGFGLPPLEAMASGTPVIVASRSCLPEVCGDAAAYVDPDDPDDMLAGIIRGLTDEAWRGDASRRGLERAKAFTWGRCIEATAEIYCTAKTIA